MTPSNQERVAEDRAKVLSMSDAELLSELHHCQACPAEAPALHPVRVDRVTHQWPTPIVLCREHGEFMHAPHGAWNPCWCEK